MMNEILKEENIPDLLFTISDHYDCWKKQIKKKERGICKHCAVFFPPTPQIYCEKLCRNASAITFSPLFSL